MRLTASIAVPALLLSLPACGSDDHPGSAVAYPEHAEHSSPIVVSDGEPAESEAANAEHADPGASLECSNDADQRLLLGSCAVKLGAEPFASGAHCLEYFDARTDASTKDLQLSCRCAQGVWSPRRCGARVDSRECVTEATTACGHSVMCYPK